MLHYWLPLSPSSASRFDPDLWQAYVKANKVRQSQPNHAEVKQHIAQQRWQDEQMVVMDPDKVVVHADHLNQFV